MKRFNIFFVAAACILTFLSSCSSSQSKKTGSDVKAKAKAEATARQGLAEAGYDYPLYGNVSKITMAQMCDGFPCGVTVITFNEAGDVAKSELYDESYLCESLFVYDADERLLNINSELTCDGDDEVLESSRMEFVYDAAGKVISKNSYGEFELESSLKFFYDEKGGLVKSVLFVDGGSSASIVCTYDGAGNMISEVGDGAARMFKYVYDENGLCTGYTMTSEMGDERREYTYDKYGNIIEVNDYLLGETEPFRILVCDITYADQASTTK